MSADLSQRRLVIYYSYSGRTRILAEAIALAVDAELTEICPLKPYPAFKPWMYLVGGFQALTGRMVPLKPMERNPEAYDMLFIGTPVWAGNLAPPVRSWLALQHIRGKRIACFASSASGEAGHVFEEIRAALPDNSFLPDLVVREERQTNLTAARLARQWALKVTQD